MLRHSNFKEIKYFILCVFIAFFHMAYSNDIPEKCLKLSGASKEKMYQKSLYYISIEHYQQSSKLINKLILTCPRDNIEYIKIHKMLESKIQEIEDSLKTTLTLIAEKPNDAAHYIKAASLYVQLHQYSKALKIINKGVKIIPNNAGLLYKRALLEIDMEKYRTAKKDLIQVMKLDPKNTQIEELLIKIAPLVKNEIKVAEKKKQQEIIKKHYVNKKIEKPKSTSEPEQQNNEIKLMSTPVYISDKNRVWTYNSISYKRISKHITYLFHINNRTRETGSGYQEGFELYPTINKHLRLQMGYDYSSHYFFPRHHALGKIILLSDSRYQVETGPEFYEVQKLKFWSQDFLLGKFFGSNWIAASARVFFGDTFKRVVLYSGIIRHSYQWNKDAFIELVGGGGESPDLLDLDDSGFEIISTYYFYLKNEFPLGKNTALSFQLGYTHQKYPKFIRNGLSLGVALGVRF